MSKIAIITPEKPKNSELKSLLDYFLKLVRPHLSIEMIYSGAVKAKTDSPQNIEIALKKEAQNFDKKIKANDKIILLTEIGEIYSTTQLLGDFNSWVDTNQRVVFILGSAYGIHQSLLNSNYTRLSLSKLTFTHEMALVIFCEQLYRLMTLRIGKRYHY
jgi:23S rRNA (pseudouridine1915-N3)-methyltransferase